MSTTTTPGINKRTKIAIVTAALALGVAGTAVAYWTQMGAGTGSAGTGNTVDVIVRQTSIVTDLYPGGPAKALSGDFDNPNDAAVTVGAVSATVTETSAAGCSAAWYTIGGAGSPASQVLDPGTSVGAWTGLTVSMLNDAANQDACKNAEITITYAVAAAA